MSRCLNVDTKLWIFPYGKPLVDSRIKKMCAFGVHGYCKTAFQKRQANLYPNSNCENDFYTCSQHWVSLHFPCWTPPPCIVLICGMTDVALLSFLFFFFFYQLSLLFLYQLLCILHELRKPSVQYVANILIFLFWYNKFNCSFAKSLLF